MTVKCYKKLVHASRPTQTNSYIVIHNSAGGVAEGVYNTFIDNKNKGSNICAHYAVDDNNIIQLLEDNWNGQHTTGVGYYKEWGTKANGVSNSNSIGIEVADGSQVNMNTANDNCIELVRHLMKTYNIPINNIVRHGDTQNKNCPQTIMENNKWNYILKTIKERNDSNKALKIDPSGFSKSNMTSDGVLDNNSSNTSEAGSGQVVVQIVFANDGNTTVQESLPNANTSDNWVDMHKIKGITLHMHPPYQNCCEVENMEATFKTLNWDRAFHYKVDYKTKVDYSKKVPLISGPSTGGNTIGSSLSDFVLIPGEGVYSGGVINNGSSNEDDGSSNDSDDFTGNSTEEIIFNFFRGKGCSIQTACGIMGNAKGESGLSTTIVNSSSKATGLFQWLGSRLTNLKSYANQQNKDWTALEVQLMFSWSELTGAECASGLKNWGGLDKFKSLSDVENATLAWEIIFERSGGQGNSTRVKYAKEYYEKFKNYTKPSNAPNTGNDSSVHGWPLPSSCTNVSSKFGVPRSNGRTHKGIDIAVATGTTVYAYAAGTVEIKDYHSSRGNYIKINHGNGTYTWYEHLSSFKVSKNDKVSSGQIIALTGNTGDSSGPHLHFELWKNNIAVDPLKYITIGGGVKSISTFNTMSNDLFKTMDIADNDVTYENIDRSKICFACADNKQHTYIDRALFNNETAKYTVSVGAFFDDQSDEIQRDANITDSDKGWPRTEKKLIQQCAQALYFEGFTSDNLWREFDLNRAPSPFIYLDREKWELFLDEVEKQVTWLNGKYGKVTATYVPNNLLKNMNLNDFIEMSPDLGVKGLNSVNKTSTKIESMDGGFFLGDKFIYLMQEAELLSGIDTICKNDLVNPWNYYGEYNSKKYDKTSEFPTSPKYVFVNLGSNNPSKIAEMQVLLNKLKNMYPDIPIFVSKLFYPNKKVKSINLDTRTKAIDKFNESISSFCSSNGLYFIDTTGNELTNNNYLSEKYCSIKFYFYTNKDGSKLYFENIKAAILSTDIISDTSSNDSNNNSSDDTTNDNNNNDNSSNNVYDSKYGYISASSAKLYSIVVDTYCANDTYYKYQEVKILSAKNDKGYHKISVKGITGYMKASALTIINNNTYGYTYKSNIGKTASIWKGSAIYKEASIYSDILEIKDNITSCTILDTDVNFYKVSLGTNSLSYGGTTGWVKAYRVNIASNTSSLFSVSEIQADSSNKGLYAYIESDLEISMYKDADSSSKVISTYYRGEEFLIEGTSKAYYKVKNTSDNKTGYIKASNLYMLDVDKYGKADKENINKQCYVKYNNTNIYEKDNTDDAYPNLMDQKQEGKIVDVSNGYYKVVFLEYNLTGWIKAYRITTSKSYFNFEKDEIGDIIGNIKEITLKNHNFEFDQNSNDSSDETTGSANNLDKLKEGWEKEGNIQFEIIKNKEDIKDGRFVYRGDYFTRLKNTKESLAGIKQKITIDKISSSENDTESGEFTIRISAWLKQVTTDDDSTGITHDSVEEYIENGITFYILNENNKVISSTNVELPKDTTCFGRVSVLFTNIKAGNYIFLIGSKKKFDIYADNFIIEQISDYNDSAGDYLTSGNIGTPGVGNTAFDNGGIMFYSQDKSTEKVSDNPPDIATIVTQDEYDTIMKNASNVLIDAYVNACEPYDKGLKEITEAPILEDDRLNTLTESINSFTGNMIRYCVVESGPGSTDHCVKPADELNVLYKQIDTNSEPVYPDLIIPPNYSTGDYDVNSNNSIPLQAIQDGLLADKDTLNKQFSFDYKTLEDKTKTSKGFAINYNDPYPYDDKVTELEKHYPKVKIDEIESRLYSCNHPGCPIALPMAKNFAMLSDMQLAQSKRIEQRLARIENVLASMVRNMGRIGARMHINCVYYGGQDIFGKKI